MRKFLRRLRIPGMAVSDARQVSDALRRAAANHIPPCVDLDLTERLTDRLMSVRRDMVRRGRYLRIEKPAAPAAPPEAEIRQFPKPRAIP